MTDQITKVTLDNGLQIMLKEIHTAPIISHWVWYRVGSRDEIPGRTGISHWVEHMQFKGTPQFPAGVLDKAISREGGVWNAFTYFDWTTYFETMPAEKIDLALRLEVDRMVNSVFEPNEVESERTVIISERQGHENEPLFQLGEALQAAAFRVHPYHHEVIGDMADLLTITRDDLYRHYRRYYTPSNALIAISGDFETDSMLKRIEELYSSLPEGEQIKRHTRPEPEQKGEHQLTIEGPGETTFLEVVYRAPNAANPDFFPYVVLDSLLTGPSGLNMFGGGISNATSRLYQQLVEAELAVSVRGSLPVTIDPFIYTITITVHPTSNVEAVLSVIDEQIDLLQQEPPKPEVLQRAVKQARALFAYGSESISNQAFWMGFSEMFDNYEWFTEYLERLEHVSPEDVQRVAQAYMTRKNRIIGVYEPTSGMEVQA